MEGKDGRTERATPKKRRKEREKGNLMISQEVISMSVLLLGVISLRIAFPMMWQKLEMLTQYITRFEHLENWTPAHIAMWSQAAFVFLGYLLAPLFVPIIAGAVIGSMVQTKPYFSMGALSWKFSALNPVKGFSKLFSMQSLVNLGLSILKIGFIILTVYLLTRKQIPVFTTLANFSNESTTAWLAGLIFRICIVVLSFFVIVAAIDWFFRNYKYEQGLMMTKQEVKDERKQEEISPHVKRRQHKRMMEFNFMRMMAAVPKANVVITNPTHVAVALQYDPETMDAPKVVAKGLRLVAERIKKIAMENDIPIVERPAMARSLYKYVKIGQYIPSVFYEAVAEVLAFLHRIGKGIKLAG